MSRTLRKAVLMAGILALFFGIAWILQGKGMLPDDLISSDPRRFGRGIVLTLAGIAAIIAARRL